MVTGGRGSLVKLEATYRDGGGNLIDPKDVTDQIDAQVIIRDPSGSDYGTYTYQAAEVVRDSLGKYHYHFDVPLTGEIGTWGATWGGTINGTWIEGTIQFNVVEAGEIGFGINIIQRVRSMLGEAGEEKIVLIVDEPQVSAGIGVVYTDLRRISDVVGVWKVDDINHTGTNYYTNGGYDTYSGKIYLGTPLPSENEPVIISYAFHSGIPDETIEQLLNDAQAWVKGYTHLDFTYGTIQSVRQQNLETLAITRAVIGCILVINGANAAQMGYNFRLEEFEIQTKLWGEGMIAEALFTQYKLLMTEYQSVVGMHVEILVGRRSKEASKYNINNLLSSTSSRTGVTLETDWWLS